MECYCRALNKGGDMWWPSRRRLLLITVYRTDWNEETLNTERASKSLCSGPQEGPERPKPRGGPENGEKRVVFLVQVQEWAFSGLLRAGERGQPGCLSATAHSSFGNSFQSPNPRGLLFQSMPRSFPLSWELTQEKKIRMGDLALSGGCLQNHQPKQ